MGEGFDIGFTAGSVVGGALSRGVAEWKQIQLKKQQQREFEGGVALYNQRTAASRQALNPQDDELLGQYEAMAKRNPQGEIMQRPTGGVREDGQADSEPVFRTPEGDIPVNQVLQMRARKAQNEDALVLSDIDALMELQARYPENPFVKQFVASTYQGIQAKQQLKFKQVQQQLAIQERLQAAQRFQLDEQKFAQERRAYEEGPARAKELEKTKTDEGIRQDAARISAQKDADIAVQGAKAQAPEAPKQTDIAGMRKEFEAKSETFSTIRANKAKIDALAQQPANSANDLAILYSYIKLLDPGSVVREGEVQLSRDGSVPDQIVSEYRRLFTTEGSRLGPNVRQQIVQNSGTIFESGLQSQRGLQERYSGLAQRAGFNPEDVVQDYTAPQQSAAPGSGGKPQVTPEAARAELERRRAARGR